jgi:hypothetical protein
MACRIEWKRKALANIELEGTDQREIEIDRRYRALGWLGLSLVCIGTALQIAAVAFS